MSPRQSTVTSHTHLVVGTIVHMTNQLRSAPRQLVRSKCISHIISARIVRVPRMSSREGALSGVDLFGVETVCPLDNELLTRCDLIAHEDFKGAFGLRGIVDGYAA